jgi:hypothetical protein
MLLHAHICIYELYLCAHALDRASVIHFLLAMVNDILSTLVLVWGHLFRGMSPSHVTVTLPSQ